MVLGIGELVKTGAQAAGGLVEGITGLAGLVFQAKNNAEMSEAEASEVAKLEELQKKIESPDFDTSMLAPEELELVYNYEPEAAQFIEEAYPDLIEKSEEAKQGTSAQLSALERFGQMAETGEDAGLIAAREGAEREAMQSISRAQAERESQGMRRGLGLGSGAQLALQQADISSLANQQQMANEQAAADAALRRMDATGRQAQVGSALTGQELDLAGRNADFINAYNARQAQRQQALEMANVAEQNAAAQERERMRQNLRTQSQEATQAERVRQQEAQNEAAQRGFQNQSSLYGQQAGITDRKLGNIGARGERTARTISGATKAAGAVLSGGLSAVGKEEEEE